MHRLALKCLIVLACCLSASAATHAIRAGATGANNGTDWNNAFRCIPATLVRGDTYYIAAGNYSSCGDYNFDDAQSGTTVITLKKATIAEHGPATGWQDSFATGPALWALNADNGTNVGSIFTFGKGFYVLDGVTGSGTSGHGIVLRDTDASNGSEVGLIRIGTSSNTNIPSITLSHLELDGNNPSGAAPGVCGRGIHATNGSSNLTFRYLYSHDFEQENIKIDSNTSDLLVEHSYFARNASSSSCHGNNIATRGTISGVTFRYNYVRDIHGTASLFTMHGSTGGGADYTDIEIYGNICEDCDAGNGTIQGHDTSTVTNFKYYNNTILNSGGNGNCGVNLKGTNSGVDVRNNLWWSNSNGAGFSGVSAGTHDHNTFLNTVPAGITLAANEVSNQSASNPFVDSAGGNYQLKAATTPGFNTGAIVAGNDVDRDGIRRGADGSWDRGAHEFDTQSANRPLPPPNVRVTGIR